MSSLDDGEGPTTSNQPPSDPEPCDLSSDEFPDTQLKRVGNFPKEGSQAKSSGLENSGDTSRQDPLGGLGARFSVPLALAATMQRRFIGEFNMFSPIKSSAEKTPSMVSGKRGGKSNHLPQATPRKKATPQKKPLGTSVSKVVLGRKPQASFLGCPPAPATFPSISGLPVLGRPEKNSLVPLGPRQPKYNAGKKPVANRTREFHLVAQEETNPNKEPVPKGQLPVRRPGPSHLSMRHGLGKNGDSKTKTSQVSGNSQHLAMVQGGIKPIAPLPLGDQGPPLHSPRHERTQPPPGAQFCSQCPVLQKEIDKLKEQLVAMQCLIDKFQML
nr:uncharacterized protein CXorf49 homolog isoform X1 [Microcebus murinus]